MLVMMPTILSSVIALITKVAATVGPMIAKYAPMVIKTLGENLPKMVKTIENISLFANVLDPNEKVDELGAKAMVADKKPEDFDQINDYIDYLRNDVEMDESTLSEDAVDVATRQAIGSAIAIKALGNELNTDISLPFLNKVSELGIEPKVVLEIIKSYSESSLNADDINDYIKDELSLEESDKHTDSLEKAYQHAYPEMSTEDVQQAVMKDF